MAIQIYKQPAFGELLGQSLGTGISQALEGLVQNKMRGLHQGNTANALQALGFNPEQSQAFSGFETPILQQLVKQKSQEPMNQQYAQMLQQILGGGAPQEGQGIGGLQGALGGGINPQQFKDLIQLSQAERKIGAQQQQFIDKQAAPVFQEIEESGKNARKVYNAYNDLVDILSGGDWKTGPLGAVLPPALQGEAGQRFLAAQSNLVLSKLENMKGVGNKARQAAIELSKPNIAFKPAANLKIAESALLDPELLSSIAKDTATQEIMEEYKGTTPKDYRNLINKRSAMIKKELKQQVRSKFDNIRAMWSLDEELKSGQLPRGTQVGEKRIIANDNGIQVPLIWTGSQWKRAQ